MCWLVPSEGKGEAATKLAAYSRAKMKKCNRSCSETLSIQPSLEFINNTKLELFFSLVEVSETDLEIKFINADQNIKHFYHQELSAIQAVSVQHL